MAYKRGKWSDEEDLMILNGIKSKKPIDVITNELKDAGYPRKQTTVQKRLEKLQISNNIQGGIQATKNLRDVLHSKEYWADLAQQFTQVELRYFEANWVELMQQFREDILPSEEMQLKQYITIDILITRSLIERKQHIEETDKLQNLVNSEYNKDEGIRDVELLSQLEQQLAYVRNSVTSYTAEYTKLLDKQQSIGKDLKANRDARIKRVEDSKSSWAGLIRALEQEGLRERMGDEMEVMKIAKNKAKNRLSQWHIYADGIVDQPFLTPETVKNDNDDNDEDEPDMGILAPV